MESFAAQPGQILARGVCRHLTRAGHACLMEFVPARGLRVDVLALCASGEIWVVECKSSRADFMSDQKWQGYLDWCDRFFWAVDADFPLELLPEETGVIRADGYDGEVIRDAPLDKLAAPRRKAITLKVGRVAAQRLTRVLDPEMAEWE
ncbi:MAG: MmcB family DNA repair protein [Pseudomonadota bacterium]